MRMDFLRSTTASLTLMKSAMPMKSAMRSCIPIEITQRILPRQGLQFNSMLVH